MPVGPLPERRARLAKIVLAAWKGRLPPEGWQREFGLSDDENWDRDHVPTSAVPREHYASIAEWTDGYLAEQEFRQEIVEHVRVVEDLRKNPQTLQDIFAPAPRVDPEQRIAASRRSQQRKWDGVEAWRTLRRLRPEALGKIRIFRMPCASDGCPLIDVYPRRDAESGVERLLIVAHQTHGDAHKAIMAAERGEDTEDTIDFGCEHGHGRYPVRYPAHIRRSGPPQRRAVVYLLDEVPSLHWTPHEETGGAPAADGTDRPRPSHGGKRRARVTPGRPGPRQLHDGGPSAPNPRSRRARSTDDDDGGPGAPHSAR